MDSGSANKILDEAVSDGINYLPKLEEGLMSVVTLFREGQEGEGISLFQQSIEGLEWFGTVLAALGRFRDSENTYSGLTLTYNDKLNELLEAWQNMDMVLIGDLIEYEIVPIIDKVMNDIKEGTQN